MFSSRSLFSDIPCPHQEDCKIPRCLFQHPSPQAQPTLPASNANDVSDATAEEEPSEYDGPRKRQKLDGNGSKELVEVSYSSIPIPSISSPATGHGNSEVERKEKMSTTAPKPAAIQNKGGVESKNNILKTAKPPSSSTTTDRQTSQSSLSKAAATKASAKLNVDTKSPKDFYSPVPKIKKAPEKAEGLYPRMINPAPAKYDVRHRLLKMLHEHFVRLNTELAKDAASKDLLLSDQALITLALDMEENAATDKPSIYSNVVKNKILYYKRMVVADWKKERQPELEAKVAKESKNDPSTSTSNPNDVQKQIQSTPKPIKTGLSEYHELLLLHRLYADFVSIPQDKHGFVIKPPTEEMIETSLKGLKAANNWECCERCKTRFQVFPGRRESDGVLTTGGPCSFHWGKPFWQDLGQGARGKGDRKYQCCGEAVGISAGCVKNEHHVFKVTNAPRMATVLQFLETPENPELENELGEKEVLRPVCIDGEMAFTVYGLELVRLTATSWPSGSELLDILVRPIGEITDLNSRFSGVWPQQLADAKPWTETDSGSSTDLRIVSGPVEARNLLLRLLTPKTPIVGHGLENDLNAIRLVHPTIIDTALLFPHKSGLPYRLPLKKLMLDHLGRHIQLPVHSENAHEVLKTSAAAEDGDAAAVANGGAGGHDSKEDANAAGDLVHFAIVKEWEKMKREGWSWRDPTSSTDLSQSSSSSSQADKNTTLTPFEQHFIAPRTKAKIPTGPRSNKPNNLLTAEFLEASSAIRDPTIQAPSVRDGRFGVGGMMGAGGAREESAEERLNRERAERRRRDGEHKRKLEDEDRGEEEGRREVKRVRGGRSIIGYGDLDGAMDSDDGEGEGSA